MYITGSDGGGALIGAAAGGSVMAVILLILLCVLVVVVRRSYKKHHKHETAIGAVAETYDYAELASTIKMDYNPSYGIIDKDGNAVKMDSNPSYDVTDLSCDTAKPMSEDHYYYVERETPSFHTVKMEINPSYQSTGDNKVNSAANSEKKISNERNSYMEVYHTEDDVKMQANSSTTGDRTPKSNLDDYTTILPNV